MMKNNIKVLGYILGLGMFLTITPSYVAAEESESTIPSLEINLLSQDTEQAEILDVKASDLLLGMDNIEVKIPNVDETAEELAFVSITNDEIGTIEANVLTKTETETDTLNEQAVVDVEIEDIPIVNQVDVEALKKEENTSTDSISSESALVDVAVEDLIVTQDEDVEVLKNIENTSIASDTSESALVDVAVEELIVTEDVDVEVLKNIENKSTASDTSESVLVDVTVEELIVTEDVDVEVLKNIENTSTDFISSESTLVDVTIEDLIVTDQVELSVLDSENFMKNENQKEAQQGVHLKLNNLPLLEELHVGVLGNQFIKKNNSQQEESSLITIGLGEESSLANSPIDKVELNVLENSHFSNENLQAEKSAVVGLELNGTSIGDLSTYVLLSESTIAKENSTNNSGLIEVNNDDLLLLEDIHLGVLDRHVEEDDKAYSLSEGLLQLDLLSNLTEEVSIDVLANDELSNNSGTYRNRKTISIDLTNDVVGEVIVDILPTENYVAATPTNPMPPMEGIVEEVVDKEIEGDSSEDITIVADTPPEEDNLIPENEPVTNEAEEGVDNQNTTSDEGIIVVEDEGLNSANMMIQTPTVTEDDEENLTEEDRFSLGVNFNNNDSNFFTGSSLPQTGGFFTGIMLLIIALSLLGSGWTIRKLA